MMRSLLIFSVCLMLCQNALAQFEKANDYFQKKEYAKAIPLYEEALKGKESLLAKTRLAQCYQMLNKTVQAESLLSEVVKEPRAKVISYKIYGEVLMSNGKYEEAKKWFLDYHKLAQNDSTALLLAASCDEVMNLKPYFSLIQVKQAPFNSTEDDNMATFGPDGLVFTSDRTLDKALLKQKSGATGRDFLKLWTVSPQDSSWTNPEHFSNKVNSLNSNTAGITFDKEGRLAAFSRNNTTTSKKGEYKMHIYASEISAGGKLERPEKLNFCIDELNYMHPTLSADGRQIVFSSDSKGEGGMDLFISTIKKDGKWGTPKNLGSTINTARHEAFPYLTADGHLFFASKGHAGLGGFDLFVSTFDTLNNTWLKPINLGAPINSAADDISFAFAPGAKAGTFSSTRTSGTDDIFLFWLSELEPQWAKLFEKPIAVPQPAEQVIDGKSGDADH